METSRRKEGEETGGQTWGDKKQSGSQGKGGEEMGRTGDGKTSEKMTGSHWGEETVGLAHGETWRLTGRGARKTDGWGDRQKRWETEKQTGGEAGRLMRKKRMRHWQEKR